MSTHHTLVTGGAGFIGSHLCRYLLNIGHDVTVVDNMSTGREDNIADLADNPRFTLRAADVSLPGSFVELDTLTHIVHLACPASPKANTRMPLDTIRACSVGTLNVLDLAARTGTRVVCASSSEIYGDPLEHPQNETYRGNCDPVGAFSAYTEGKRVLEAAAAAHVREGTNAGIIRPFNIYGPNMWPEDGRVVSSFCASALRGATLEIAGGEQTRSFCYIGDFIEGVVRMMDSDAFGPVNLGNPACEVSIAELAQLVVRIAGTGRAQIVPGRSGETHRRQPDTDLAARVLSWSAITSLDTGIERTLDWMSQVIHAESSVR
ncbi:NAD-dependent epimerase/dehydratase family protein [Nocardia sp. NPDC004860]|uniref:NAD-dependent epimerase/dehydratase family protein n=1 Tax=Nocardia sp. NPDC004860 TaxID=3154557 RepID=UPI0033BF6697